MRVSLLTLLTIALAVPGVSWADETKCGTRKVLTVANMTWLSSGVLAQVTQRILADGYGCRVRLVPGDTVPTAVSMLSKSRPHIAPELWISTAQSIWKKILKKGNVYKASDVFSKGAVEGWWIPDYIAKAHPDLKSITDLKKPKFAKLFRDRQSGGKGRVLGCPPGWGCEIVSNNLFRALNLKNANYELFSPGSGANLKAAIARKVQRKKPMVGYYWSPTAVIGRYKLKLLKMPKVEEKKFECLTDRKCQKPQVTGWKHGEVVVAAVTKLKKMAPNVAKYLGKMQIPNKLMVKTLAWGDRSRSTPEEIAVHFLKTYPKVWTQWVPAAVASRVKSKL